MVGKNREGNVPAHQQTHPAAAATHRSPSQRTGCNSRDSHPAGRKSNRPGSRSNCGDCPGGGSLSFSLRRAGMRGEVGGFEPFDGHMRVDLRGRETRVTEQGLHASQVRAGVEQMGRKSVS